MPKKIPPKLILMHGYIGVGKTTFAKNLSATTGAVLFVADDWMVHFYGQNPEESRFTEFYKNVESMIWSTAQKFLIMGHDVILDFGFWKRSERDAYRNHAEEVGAVSELYHVTCPDTVAKKRTLARTYDLTANNIFIDENAYEVLKACFEPLGEDEDCIVVQMES